MRGKIDMLAVLTDDVAAMVAFYRDVLGFQVEADHGEHVEFVHEGVRFAVSGRGYLTEVVGVELPSGASRVGAFGLAFREATAEAVDAAYAELIARGARPVKPPSTMPWGQRTGFFADPEGNIHEVFADLTGGPPGAG